MPIAIPTAALPPPRDVPTLADLVGRLGGVPLDRILLHPAPGTATEKDVVALDDKRIRHCELVEATLVEKAMGFRESHLAIVLAIALGRYLDTHPLGVCTGADGLLRLAPGLVRIPDLAFFAWDKFPGGSLPKEPIPDLVPDLAVEILSASNTRAEMARKVREYFDAGARLVWLIDPEARTARAFTAVDRETVLDDTQSLDGGDVLPGFRTPLRDLFDASERPRTS